MNKAQILNAIKLTLIFGIAFLAILSVDGIISGTDVDTSVESTTGFFSVTTPYVSADTNDCPGSPGGCH